ncbi:MAG: AAA family ATPase, partial [Limnothrix sp. RL_2_0]|nr:AAA family ATPase [Limnothrix sp. RL_2_0]
MSQSFVSSLKQQHIVYVHDDLQKQLISKEFSKYTKKIDWIIRNFILDGSTSNIKTISYHSLKWRRTSIDGNSFYLWWISSKESGTQNIRQNPKEEIWEFYLRLIRPHDDNPIELELGTTENYPQAMQMIDLDPCKDEQTQVIENISYSDQHEYIIDSIRGNPGSGKTVTLEYAAIQLSSVHDQKIQYITYTSGLKNRAEKFFKAVDKSNNIKALTFDEFLGSYNYKKDHNLKLFQEFLVKYIKSPVGLQKLGKNSLGLWAKNEEILRIELRAYIYGISLPFNWERGDLHIDGSKGLIKKAQYKKLRQKTSISDVELEIAYTIALALYEKQDNYKKVFPDLYYARKTLEDFIKNKSKVDNNDHCDAIIIDEVQDLTLLQIALVFEKGKFLKNPHNHLAFRFIIAGDESQTLLHSGFKWDFTNNLFTSKFLHTSKIPQEHSFKSNYRNPLLISELVESTYNLYSRYTNKELTPKSSSKTDNLHENRELGKIILWQMSEGHSIPNPQKLSEDLNNLPSEIVVIDLSSKRLEKYQQNKHRLPFYYSDREIKGLEREVVFIVGLSSKIKELKQNKQKNHYIVLQKNRKIIDSIRVVFSRSTKLLIIADFEASVIENEFSSLNKEEYSWEEIQSVLEKELKTDQLNPLDEAFGLINIIDQTIDDGYIDRAQQYLKKVRIISQKYEDKSLEQLIENLETKILDAQLSATKREILDGNPNAEKFFIKLTQNAKYKNIEIQSFKSFQDIKGYFDWCQLANEYLNIFEIQAINDISGEYFQNSLDLLTSISEDNYFVTEKKIDLQEKTKLF